VIPSDAERLYYTWLEENHPEEFRRRIEEEDYYYNLEKQWRASLPSERDFLLAFPGEIKPQIKELKRERETLHKAAREYQNEIARPKNDFTTILLAQCRKAMEEITKQITKLEWYIKPKEQRAELDIARAKAVPITNMIEFKRKVALCLWHTEKNASMTYFPSTNKVWCFACSNGGDAIDVAMKLWDVDMKEAVAKLTN
jgi:hypothetical protein